MRILISLRSLLKESDSDPSDCVQALAMRTLARVMERVVKVTLSESNFFNEYILPILFPKYADADRE
jgi:hypothetical protein